MRQKKMKPKKVMIVDDGKKNHFMVEMEYDYFKKPLTELEKSILKLIPKDHRISQADIHRLLGIPERTVRDNVLMMIKKGVPIDSNSSSYNFGYILITTKEQLKQAIERNRHRCEEALARVAGLANADLDKWK